MIDIDQQDILRSTTVGDKLVLTTEDRVDVYSEPGRVLLHRQTVAGKTESQMHAFHKDFIVKLGNGKVKLNQAATAGEPSLLEKLQTAEPEEEAKSTKPTK